jgi:AraC-like DNA-binding protein
MLQRNSGLVPITEISTERVPRARRVELWESYNASSLVGIRCSDFSKRGLRARARNFDLGAVRIMEMRANEHVVERTGPMVHAHPKNSIFICLLLEGEGFFFQSGKCIPVVPGDVIALFSDIPHLYGWTRESRQVIVEMDSSRLPDCSPADRLQSPLKLDSRLRSARFLASALRSTAVPFVDHPSAAEAPQVAKRARSLLETMLGFPACYREGTDTAAWQLLRAEMLIAEHLADPDLTALSVAHALRISVRHLNRLFATRKTTVSDWIWSQRLARAREDLGSAYGRSVPVAEVAFRWGFVNQGHFARRFKEQYGVTPTQHRQQPLVTS